MLPTIFYFIGGLAHVFPTYFLLSKSQKIQNIQNIQKKETKESSKNYIGSSKYALWSVILFICLNTRPLIVEHVL